MSLFGGEAFSFFGRYVEDKYDFLQVSPCQVQPSTWSAANNQNLSTPPPYAFLFSNDILDISHSHALNKKLLLSCQLACIPYTSRKHTIPQYNLNRYCLDTFHSRQEVGVTQSYTFVHVDVRISRTDGHLRALLMLIILWMIVGSSTLFGPIPILFPIIRMSVFYCHKNNDEKRCWWSNKKNQPTQSKDEWGVCIAVGF